MAEDKVRRLAVEQRKRLIAGLLNAVEATPWYSRLNAAERAAYRRDVMDRVGTYHDFMLDVIKVADDEDVMVNERVLDMLETLHQGQRSLTRALAEQPSG